MRKRKKKEKKKEKVRINWGKVKKMINKVTIAGSAFEQFEIIRIIPIHPIGNLDISITNSTIFMIIGVGIFYIIYNINIKKGGKIVPTRWQSIIEIIYDGVNKLVKENIGKEGGKYFPIIFTLFIFIGTMNLVGLIPYTFTPTAHIIVTFGLSLSIFITINIIGIITHKTDFISMFVPGGSPIMLAPFLVVIELVSHIAKAISLGVRLAANITAGHLLFAIISGFVWRMLMAGGIIAIASVFPMAVVILITVLEIAVAVIQVYVFCVLTTIYIHDSINLH